MFDRSEIWRVALVDMAGCCVSKFRQLHDLFQVKLKFSSIGLPGGDVLKGIMAQIKMQSIDFKRQTKVEMGNWAWI